jgi:hypothetical protein
MYRGRLILGDDPGISIAHDSGHSSRLIGKPASQFHSTKRIACLLVADLAIAAMTRANPELRDLPFALIRMPTARSPLSNSNGRAGQPAAYQPHSELSHVSPFARAAGLRPAMTVAQARGLIPDLFVMSPSYAAGR